MNNYITQKDKHGTLTISNRTGQVSWKLHADYGVQIITAIKDGKTGASIAVEEAYTNDANKIVSKKAYIHLEAEQIDALIAHLQDIKAQF